VSLLVLPLVQIWLIGQAAPAGDTGKQRAAPYGSSRLAQKIRQSRSIGRHLSQRKAQLFSKRELILGRDTLAHHERHPKADEFGQCPPELRAIHFRAGALAH
jgi:hypothetical protein